MDPDEYEEYLALVFGKDPFDPYEQELIEQLRDDEGYRVPGCYVVKPAQPER